MTNDLTLIQKLVAIELGCEWCVYHRFITDSPYDNHIPEDQSLQSALHCLNQKRYDGIGLTSNPWDFPTCERSGVLCWRRIHMRHHGVWQFAWRSGYIDHWEENEWVEDIYVAANPLNPDEVPPLDWSADGRRVIK